jgi:hypothetical protein
MCQGGKTIRWLVYVSALDHPAQARRIIHD